MRVIRERGIVLEVCPLSNLMTRAVKNNDELRFILQTFFENKVKIIINTDWPEMIKDAHVIQQCIYLEKNKILTKKQIEQTIQWSFDSTFINLKNKHGNLYI
jgi:adenosine deaminase